MRALIVRSPKLSTLDEDYIKTFATEVFSSDEAEIILAIGGDNTMLQAIHQHYNVSLPFYGINMGRVGFLLNNTHIESKSAMYDAVNSAKQLKLYSIQARINYSEGPSISRVVTGFNDIWISPRGAQALRMKMTINDREIHGHIVGDGIIVSTPQGSTGYSRAAGGKIIKPSLPVIQVTPKACTIGPRREVWRSSFIEKNDAIIKVEFEDFEYRPCNVYYDGLEAAPHRPIKSIEFSTSKLAVNLLFDSDRGFYDKIFKLETGEYDV